MESVQAPTPLVKSATDSDILFFVLFDQLSVSSSIMISMKQSKAAKAARKFSRNSRLWNRRLDKQETRKLRRSRDAKRRI